MNVAELIASDDSGEFINPYRAPKSAEVSTGYQVSDLIPYRNRPALVGYYVGVITLVGLVPVLGVFFLPLCLVALWYGYRGVLLYNAQPDVGGQTHARIALALGGGVLIVGAVLQIGAFLMAFDLLDDVRDKMAEPISMPPGMRATVLND
jgi:hypothetical protein